MELERASTMGDKRRMSGADELASASKTCGRKMIKEEDLQGAGEME